MPVQLVNCHYCDDISRPHPPISRQAVANHKRQWLYRNSIASTAAAGVHVGSNSHPVRLEDDVGADLSFSNGPLPQIDHQINAADNSSKFRINNLHAGNDRTSAA